MLTEPELELAAEAGIAVFEQRVILEAQPPVDDDTLRAVAERCVGPLPEALVALWRTAFGGSLNYDLRADFGDYTAVLSFAELFYPDSGGYRDLWGWIDFELQLGGTGTLEMLPFGGFEYLERCYVETTEGAGHGSVWAWQEALPPGWQLKPEEDSAARVADDLRALFRHLVLEQDPWGADPDDTAQGFELAEAIDSLPAGGDGGRLADKLRGLVRATVLDWRPAVADGTVASSRQLRRLAMERAAGADDVDLMARLVGLGCPAGEELAGGATALDIAVRVGSLGVARWLLRQGVPVTNALRSGAHAVDAELAAELVARGAIVDETALYKAVSHGRVEVAEVLSDAPTRSGNLRRIADAARERASAEGDERLKALAERLRQP